MGAHGLHVEGFVRSKRMSSSLSSLNNLRVQEALCYLQISVQLQGLNICRADMLCPRLRGIIGRMFCIIHFDASIGNKAHSFHTAGTCSESRTGGRSETSLLEGVRSQLR